MLGLVAAAGLPSVPLKIAIGYVAAAYIGMWVILFGYLLVMGGKLTNLRRQVDVLTEEVERKNRKAVKDNESSVTNRV